MITDAEGIAAVKAARAVAEAETEDRLIQPDLPESFTRTKQGVFVTLNEYPSGVLRGCIGYPIPPFDLAHTLCISARGACHDPRFPPLRNTQVGRCTIEVSILTEPQKIVYETVEDLTSQIEIGKDGISVKYVRNSGLINSAIFLPQVPVEQGWGHKEYLSYLCRKAGLQEEAWKSCALEFEKFQAEVFGEMEPRGEIVRK